MNNYTRTPRASRRSKKAGLRRTLLVVCMMLVVMVGSIAGTVAWLTATSGEVTNTFTVGDINIKLEESTGDKYKVIPGATVEKDPKVTIESGSEQCYVYVSVENNLKLNGTVVVTPNIDTTDWVVVTTKGNATLYRYKDVVDAASEAVELPVFTRVTAAGTITKSNITTLNGATIVLNAYAHQSENTDQNTADAAAIAWAFPASAN